MLQKRAKGEAEIRASRWCGRAGTRHHAACDRVRPQRQDRPASQPRLAIGTAMSAGFCRGHRAAGDGREGRRRRQSRDDAGISDRRTHYVQTKTPLLTIDPVRRGKPRAARRLRGARLDGRLNGTTALGIAVVARRDQDAARGSDLQKRPLFVGGAVLSGVDLRAQIGCSATRPAPAGATASGTR